MIGESQIIATTGEVILVDQEDVERLTGYRWKVGKDGYVVRRAHSLYVYIHRAVLRLPPRSVNGLEVDHIDGNKLDNRKSNIRTVTPSQNMMNMPLTSRNSTGFKGVTFHKKCRKFQSAIGAGGVYKYLGLFATAEQAARAYDAAAAEMHGVYARLNFPESAP